MNLPNCSFEDFCQAFKKLVQIAQDNQKAREYVYQLHNKITNGATERIFQHGGLELQHLKVTENNFKRYVECQEFDINNALIHFNPFSTRHNHSIRTSFSE